MLAKLLDKIKSSQYHIFLAVCIILISFISFNMGKIASNEKGTIKISESGDVKVGSSNLKAQIFEASDNAPSTTVNYPTATPKPLDMRVVVSTASDSRKYHHFWCGSWKKIKPENQLWFNSAEEAEKEGYTLAGNCTK